MRSAAPLGVGCNWGLGIVTVDLIRLVAECENGPDSSVHQVDSEIVWARITVKHHGHVDAHRSVKAKMKQKGAELVRFSGLIVEDVWIASVSWLSRELQSSSILDEPLKVPCVRALMEYKAKYWLGFASQLLAKVMIVKPPNNAVKTLNKPLRVWCSD